MTVSNSARLPHPYPYLSLGAPAGLEPASRRAKASALLPSFFSFSFFACAQCGDRTRDLVSSKLLHYCARRKIKRQSALCQKVLENAYL